LKLIKYGAGLLFFALFLTAIVVPAAAWEKQDWLEGDNTGYMINNVIIEVSSIGISKDDDTNNTTGNASVSAWEWKNEKWEKINGTRLSLNQTMTFNASDGNYRVRVLDFREIGRYHEVKLEFWTDANVTNSGKIDGGHENAEGAGKPNLIITKVVTPSDSVSVDDIVTVTLFVENKGNYDAKNVTIVDPYQTGFIMMNVTVNNTVNQTINKNSNNTYLVYQLKAADPGEYTLPKATASAENTIGVKFNYTQTNNAIIRVSELAALTFTSPPPSGNTVDYYTRTKIDGTITVRNSGTMPAQFINIEFTLPDNATISGKNITVSGNKANLYIDQITPNNERVVEYALSADAGGNYEVGITYQYTYNGSTKSGPVNTIAYRAVGNNSIATLLEYWYVALIPIILILIVGFFFIKKRNEYRY